MIKYFTSNFSNHVNSHYSIYVLLLVIFIFLSGANVAKGADTTSPKLISSNPADAEINVPFTQRTIYFTFNEAMQPLNEVKWLELSVGTEIEKIIWSSDQKTIYFTFNKNLPIDTTVSWVLNPSTNKNGFVDLSGNYLPFDTYSGSFITSNDADTTPPKLFSSIPADGEINIPSNQRTISYTFNEAMQPEKGVTWWGLSADSAIDKIEWSSNQKTIYFTFNKNLPIDKTMSWVLNPSTHKKGFVDLSGNPLPFDKYSGEFRTSGPEESIPTTISIKSIGDSGYLTNSNYGIIIDVKDQYGNPITTGLTFNVNLASYVDTYFNTPTVTSSGNDYIVQIQQHEDKTMKVPVTITATDVKGNKISKTFDMKYTSDWVNANADADIIFDNIESGVQVGISNYKWRKITRANQNFYFAFPLYDDENGYTGYLVVDENGNIPTPDVIENVVFATQVGPALQDTNFANEMVDIGENFIDLSTLTKIGELTIDARDDAARALGFIGGTYVGGTFTHAITTTKYVSQAVKAVKFINNVLGVYDKIGDISESSLRTTGRAMLGLHGAQTYLISSEIEDYPYNLDIYDYELCKELKFLWETSIAGGVIGVQLAASETPSADFESQVEEIIWKAAEGAGLPTNIINYGDPLDKSLKIMGNAALRGEQVEIDFEDYNNFIFNRARYSSGIFPSSKKVFTNMDDLNTLLPTEKPTFTTIIDVSLIEPYSSTVDLLSDASSLIKKTLDNKGIDYSKIYLDCPSDMLIINETGARIGFVNGSFINEIENAYPLSLGEYESYILPSNQTYNIIIFSSDGSDMSKTTNINIETNVHGNRTYLAYNNLSIFDDSSIKTTISDEISNFGLSYYENQDGAIEQIIFPDNLITINQSANYSNAFVTTKGNKVYSIEDVNNKISITIFPNKSYDNEVIQILKDDTPKIRNIIPIRFININPSNNISEFMVWSTIKIYYTDKELDTLNVSESSLKIYWYNGTNWEELESYISTSENYVMTNISHFSRYGIGGQPKTDLILNETSITLFNQNISNEKTGSIDTDLNNITNYFADLSDSPSIILLIILVPVILFIIIIVVIRFK